MHLDIRKKQWEKYIFNDELPEDLHPAIAVSWKKCKHIGLDPFGGRGKRADADIFRSIYEANQWLIDIVLPIMNNLADIVRASHFLLVLTDSCGYILETIGDGTVSFWAQDLRFERGMLWSDEEVGSNAIGIALEQDIPLQMAGAEHYCESHHRWTCSAAPIHGLGGEVVGCINLSGDAEAMHSHTLGIVVAAALGIETQLKQNHNTNLMHTALNSTSDSVVILDRNFRCAWMNKRSQGILGMNLDTLSKLDFRELMPDIEWHQQESFSAGRPQNRTDCTVLTQAETLVCSASIFPILTGNKLDGYCVTFDRQERLLKTVNRVTGNLALYTFDDVVAQDTAMKRTVQLAQKYAQYDGTILIEGESGTGKELLAQAIHNASQRADGPFVTLNHSALPREFIEGELFGYGKGADISVTKEGKPGKLEMADHGTLFLDDIGEMPLDLQEKLLRMMQTHSAQRLGSNVEHQLDIRIIAAVSHSLEKEVERRIFRRDLYNAINILKLDIAPLRERKEDILYCAERFLEQFNRKYPDNVKEMDASFLHSLQDYPWPGNVRELQICIERAYYTCEGSVITADVFCPMHSAVEAELWNPASRAEWTLEDAEKDTIRCVLESCGGNVEISAKKMGISRASLYRKLKKYGLHSSRRNMGA